MAKKQPAESGQIKALVLVDSQAGKCKAIVEADAAQIAEWVAAGWVDAHPEAVKSVKG